MDFEKYIKKVKTNYVINKIKLAKIPCFEPTPVIRMKIIFTGKVQNVGFRLEVYELAKRLGLIGHVRNKNDHKVESEIQGEHKKILFLVHHMKKLKRGEVIKVDAVKIPMLENENRFSIIR